MIIIQKNLLAASFKMNMKRLLMKSSQDVFSTVCYMFVCSPSSSPLQPHQMTIKIQNVFGIKLPPPLFDTEQILEILAIPIHP